MTAALDRSPAASPAALARHALETTLIDLPVLGPRGSRARLAETIGRALPLVARLEQSSLEDPDHLDALEHATSALATVRQAFTLDHAVADVASRLGEIERALRDARSATIDAVVALQLELRPAPRRPEDPARMPFRASAGVPSLRAIARAPLVPTVDAGEDDDLDDEDLDRLADEAAEEEDAGWAAEEPDGIEPAGAATPEADDPLDFDAEAQLRRLLRDCLEELGALGVLRGGRQDLAAGAVLGFERRLLADLDAVMALGAPCTDPGDGSVIRLDVLGEVQRWADDAFVADPGRAFARAFVLGCVEGDDKVRAAVTALRASSRWTFAAQRDALSLVPSAAVAPAMIELCRSDEAELVQVAAAVLGTRREASFGDLAPAVSHPHAGVRAAAARGLSTVPERGPAANLLVRALAGELDQDAAASMAEALVVLDQPSGLVFARERLALAASAETALSRVLSIAGSEADSALLVRRLRDDPAEATALGWHGDLASIEALLARYERGSHWALTGAIVGALHRLTGIDCGQPPEERAAGWFDAGAFRRAWSDARRDLDPRARHRFGRPITVDAVIGEMVADGTHGEARGWCALELAVLSGGRSPIDASDWIVRQRAQAEALRDLFSGRPDLHRTGEWPAQRLGKRWG